MKVRELKAKYPNYAVIEMGYPNCIPFTMLPNELKGLRGKEFDKVCDELEVKGYEVFHNKHTDIDITHVLLGGKKKPNRTYDGTLYIYLRGDKAI